MHWVKNALVNMASGLLSGDEAYDQIMENLEDATSSLNINIRHPDNRRALLHLSSMLLEIAEERYGESNLKSEDLCLSPSLYPLARSRVGQTMATDEMPRVQHLVCIGTSVTSWEQLFYEVAHETLHLLGPTDISVDPVARLEEGVAVKFAEDVYESFVFPFSERKPDSSPADAPWSVYHGAYARTNKVPDSVLKEVRDQFINFKNVESEGLYKLASAYITEAEAQYLSLPFNYNAP